MSVNRHYIQMEAINLDTIIFDTQDNRCMRAGSFLLLDLMEQLKHRAEQKGCQILHCGGSQLVVGVEADEDRVAEVEQELRTELEYLLETDSETNEHWCDAISSACVTIARLAATGDFAADMRSLQTRIHFNQLQQPTFWMNPLHAANAVAPCARNGILPATHDLPGGRVSSSVYHRSLMGSGLRSKYFREYTKQQLIFTDNLEELTTCRSNALGGKMALLHLDGNAFARARGNAGNDAEWSRFSGVLEEVRNTFLKRLVAQAAGDPQWVNSVDKLRIEALMLGGDEMTLVVPAWRGWQTLKIFFETVRGTSFNNKALTWSAGLVFCHHKAPLLHVRNLALDLCERAKKDGRRTINACHTLVMESFDGLPGGLDSYFGDYLNPSSLADSVQLNSGQLLLEADRLDDIEAAHGLIRSIARGQLYSFVQRAQLNADTRRSLVEDLQIHETGALCQPYKQLAEHVEGDAEVRSLLRNWLQDLQTTDPGEQLAIWMRQIELLDYIVPTEQKEVGHA